MDCTLYLEIYANKKWDRKRLLNTGLTKYTNLPSFLSWVHHSKKVTWTLACTQGCVSCLMHILLGAGLPWGQHLVAFVTSCGELWPREEEGARGPPVPGRHHIASRLRAGSGHARGATGMLWCAKRDERLSPDCLRFVRVI